MRNLQQGTHRFSGPALVGLFLLHAAAGTALAAGFGITINTVDASELGFQPASRPNIFLVRLGKRASSLPATARILWMVGGT